MSGEVREGDYVVLVDERGKKIIVKTKKDELVHTHNGVIDSNEVIGKNFGGEVKTRLGIKFYILQPTLPDLLKKFRRPTQIIYPKDAGLMIIISGIKSGSKVIECGTGSGSLTAFLAHIVKPEGKVLTFEKREKFAQAALKNLKMANLTEYVELRIQDFVEAEVEKNLFDAGFIDIASPWLVIKKMHEVLKPGKFLFSFSPSLNQVQKTVLTMKEEGFLQIETVECLTRNILVDEKKIRPAGRMIAHTGYITYGRKILK